MDEARRLVAREAEAAARSSYGKLLSILAARSGDIASAEDALADAFAAALVQWPRDGVPINPPGWLLTVARRSIGHAAARRQTVAATIDWVRLLQDERDEAVPSAFGDERLALMFVCAHPAIDVEAQAPLMLQTVLGLDAARIAACFLVSGATMGQRLVRAKRKVRDAGIAFAVPEPAMAAERVGGVLSAVYAAFGTAWEDVNGADGKLVGLSAEAIWLGRLLRQLLPDDPEVMGLLSLMLHCEARRSARRDPAGAFVPLNRQATALWSRPMIVEAEALLRSAARTNTPGRFQTEAAIQSLHAHQRMTGERFTEPLARLYDVLAGVAPTTGVLVARAVAHAENGDPVSGLRQLDGITGAGGYQPWWAARARTCWLAGDEEMAWDAARTAAGLSADPSVRRFLLDGGFRGEEQSPPAGPL
jgi:RNA polymerase sigma-70 factor (ECF subfamily)